MFSILSYTFFANPAWKPPVATTGESAWENAMAKDARDGVKFVKPPDAASHADGCINGTCHLSANESP